MGASVDKAVGAGACIAALVIFVYYSTWSLVLPFVDEDSSLKDFFPSWEYSIYLPAVVLVAGVSGITAFFLKTTSKKKDTQKAK